MLTNIFKIGGHDIVIHVSASAQNTLTVRLAGRTARIGIKETCVQVFATRNRKKRRFVNLKKQSHYHSEQALRVPGV